MPLEKRAPQDSTGAGPASKTQRQDDNGEGPSTRSEPEQANGSPSDSGEEDIDPYKYMCMVVPQWADEFGMNEDDEDRGVPVHSKPASEHPEWKWVVMDETWMIMTGWHRRASYRDPDNCDKYTQKRANGKPKLGGTQYDITKMSSEERASYNFDKVDPLPKDIPKGAVLELRR
ncbi:hypothetical protein MBLNU13_g06818t1 [Cladosporium sp. NU13]